MNLLNKLCKKYKRKGQSKFNNYQYGVTKGGGF